MPTKRSLLVTALMGGVLTVVANVVLLFIGKPFTGVPDTFMTLSPMPVVLWSVLGTIGASVTFFLVRKFAKNPNKTFGLIALLVLIVSFIPDVLIHGMVTGPFAGATWRAVLLLMLMHVAAASVLVSVLVTQTRPVTHA